MNDHVIKMARQMGMAEVAADELHNVDSSNLTLHLTNSLPRFETAKVPFSQVLSNLIHNSMQHNHRAHCEMTIDCRDQDNYYEFSIADNGPGVDPNQVDKIFQIFQTLDSASDDFT